MNAIASVDTKGLGVDKWTVNFRFQTPRPEPPYHHCTFLYGTDASYSNLPYCVECSNNTYNGIFTVHLAGDLMSNETYYYQAIIDENRVQGTFRIDPYCKLYIFKWTLGSLLINKFSSRLLAMFLLRELYINFYISQLLANSYQLFDNTEQLERCQSVQS